MQWGPAEIKTEILFQTHPLPLSETCAWIEAMAVELGALRLQKIC